MITKILTFLFIFSSPFSAWLAFSPWLRFPVLVSLIISIVSIFHIFLAKKTKLYISLYDLFLLIFLIICLISSFLHVDYFTQKDINNVIAIIFIVLIIYFSPKMFFYIKIKNYKMVPFLKKTFQFTYFIVSILVIFDFLLKNYMNYEIYKYFIIYDVSNAFYFYRANLWTPAGPAEEPAYTAFFLNILLLFNLAFTASKKEFIKKNLFFYLIFHIIVLSMLGSVAGIFLFFLSIFLALVIPFKKYKIKYLAIFSLILIIFGIFLFQYLQEIDFFNKILLNTENKSAALRLYSWMLFFSSLNDGFYKFILGHSPAFSKLIVETGFHSTYFTFIANFGFLSFLFFSLFLISFYLIEVINQNVFIQALFWLIILNNAIVDYYYQPIIWMAFIFIIILGKINKQQSIRGCKNENNTYYA